MIRLQRTGMHIGMGLLILGGIIFMIMAFRVEERIDAKILGGAVAWACGSGMLIYSYSASAIRKLTARIAELEERSTSKNRDNEEGGQGSP